MANLLANRDLRNNAAAVDAAARLVRRAYDDVVYVLLGVGFTTCFTCFMAASAAEDALLAYLGRLAASLICGLGTMWAAGWVAGDRAGRREAGWMILFISLFPMAMAGRLISNDPFFIFNILGGIA